MKIFLLSIVLALASGALAQTPIAHGEIKGPFVWKSKIFPGTERNYWIYVPKEYEPTKPACLMVLQDGLGCAKGWNLPDVLDSLITAKLIPVMIGLFVDHGTVPADGEGNYPRFNRSFEYDGVGEKYARFLSEELLPEVKKSYNISSDPNDKSIAGASSGAICAFNAAWERPDDFSRVFSSIGTYVGLRGGHELATLVRKTEPKPLRIFLQDGNHDLNIYAGDWWAANQNMLSALTWSGYEVNHAWGEGGHDSKHTSKIISNALTWLWKDYPAPVKTHKPMNAKVNPVIEGEDWKALEPGVLHINKIAINKNGEVFFTANHNIYKIEGNGKAVAFAKLKGETGGLCFAADGTLYVGDLDQHKIFAVDGQGASRSAVSNVDAKFITASSKGIYFSEAGKNTLGFYGFATKEITYTDLVGIPTGLALNAEKSFINVGVSNSLFAYSLKITEKGTLESAQEYIHYHIPYGATTAGTEGMTVDSENLLYSATTMGIQVADQLGRVNFIFSKPAAGAIDVQIGGTDFDILYANFNGRIFSRKITGKGTPPWGPKVKPPKPGL